MTDQEAEELFSQIARILRENELDWLATEIAAEAAEGRSAPKMLSVVERDMPLLDGRMQGSRRRVEFTHVIPLTSKEHVGVSIKALRSIVVSSAVVLDELTKTLANGVPYTVSFVSEADQPSVTISSEDARRLSTAGRHLEAHLNSIEAESAH